MRRFNTQLLAQSYTKFKGTLKRLNILALCVKRFRIESLERLYIMRLVLKFLSFIFSIFIIHAALHADSNAEVFKKEVLLSRMVPQPKAVEFSGGANYILSAESGVEIILGATLPKNDELHILEIFKTYWNITPKLISKVSESLAQMPQDAYKIEVSAEGLKISAAGLSGVLQSLKTLRQLAEPVRGGKDLGAYLIAPCKIEDSPINNFRAMHLCVFAETQPYEIEKWLRLAAYYKFTHIVIDFWGTYPSQKHPEFFWENSPMNLEALKKIIKVAKQQGIVLIPQMSVLGHASGSAFRSGKHSAVDLDKSLQPYFEPTGWSWCLTNPNVRTVLTDIVVEMHELFGSPPYFHIGCDEAFDLATCDTCRNADLKALLISHIAYFQKILSDRGARAMMWHDMLLEKGDARWAKFNANAKPEQKMAEAYKELSKDIVICDWEYEFRQNKETKLLEWPTLKFFKDAGFDVIGCSWDNPKGIDGLGKFAAQEKLFGYMATVWHKNHGYPMQRILMQSAAAAWGAAPPDLEASPVPYLKRLNFDLHLRQIGWDMDIKIPEQTGVIRQQFRQSPLY